MKYISHIRTEKTNGRKFCRMPKRFWHAESRFTKEEFIEIIGKMKLCCYCLKRIAFSDALERMSKALTEHYAKFCKVPLERLIGRTQNFGDDEGYHHALTDLQKLPEWINELHIRNDRR